MNGSPEFRLLPLELLREHEEHDAAKVEELVRELQRTGVFRDPIWVARGTWVILNGHHRVAALRRLGMKRVPAWVFDYHDDSVELGRWSPGPPIAKQEVVDRASRGAPFPPKTTRHTLTVELPSRSVPLAELAS